MRDLSNEQLIKQANDTIAELERRCVVGDLNSFDLDVQYATGGVSWSHSTAECYGPSASVFEEWHTSWDESYD